MDRLIRVKEICGSRKDGIRGYLPISKSKWWELVAEGKVKKGIHLGPRTTCWKESYILSLVNSESDL